ncbi:inositol monophosphatase family protein [Leptospira sp. GIMC2001]|uniref:inositol monophosphatase family protein n=1 Tax=Leptospira sp. GIMC2001 TaxID=1513297 RepID=UPI00234B43DE|nr:inositol monophosphatase family protein [Leptospira sp. GIMC2001]WCL49555.1 inositol monophosphatase family protein [Leptospira sp. GIMC2001]
MSTSSGTIEFPMDQTQRRVEVIKANSPGFMLAARKLQKELRLFRAKNDQEEKDHINSSDRMMGDFLMDFFIKSFPKDSIVMEDKEAIQGSTGFKWVIDPIDGSMNFVRGLPMYAISIGLEYREGPVAGVVLVPCLEDIYSAILGEGATKNGDTIFPSSTTELSRSIFAPNLPSHRAKQINEIMSDLTALVTYARSIRRSGSVVLDLCWIAEGCLDGLWEKSVKHWDLCATSVILNEAGGKITDYDGKHYWNGLPEIVATNSFLHEPILEVLKNARLSIGRN